MQNDLPDIAPSAFSGLELLSSAVVLVDDQLVVRYLNPSAENLFATSSRKIVGYSLRRLIGEPAGLEGALNNVLRDNYIDRIYDTYIDEEELQACDHTILEIANRLEPRGYSSREFIWEMGKWLSEGNAKKPGSLIQTAYEEGVPIFCPAFVDSSAGFGLVKHQKERAAAGQPYMMLDAIADFRELTDIKIAGGRSGLFMVGGGVPKNFAQDTVVCAEILGVEAEMHRYAVQITVADVRDGACSSSTLKEAASWGKVQTTHEQMVFAEATTVVPLIGSDAYHRGAWKTREKRRWQKLFA